MIMLPMFDSCVFQYLFWTHGLAEHRASLGAPKTCHSAHLWERQYCKESRYLPPWGILASHILFNCYWWLITDDNILKSCQNIWRTGKSNSVYVCVPVCVMCMCCYLMHPEGKLLDGERCVESSDCSCIHSGRHYPPGFTIFQDCNSW